MADRLEQAGARVTQKNDLGSVIAFRALAGNEIDAYVDYSGTLWTTVLGPQGHAAPRRSFWPNSPVS